MNFNSLTIKFFIFVGVVLAVSTSPLVTLINSNNTQSNVQNAMSNTDFIGIQTQTNTYMNYLVTTDISVAVAATLIFTMLLMSRPLVGGIYMMFLGLIQIFIGANLTGIIPNTFITLIQVILTFVTFFAIANYFNGRRMEEV